MGKKTIYGICHVCGTYAGLSEEHVPPQAAPNKQTYIELTFDEATNIGPEDIPKGPKRQGGVRFPSLCGRCNNKFGGWYNIELNKWYWGGRYILERVQDEAAAFSASVYPLRIIKGVIAMFFSVVGEDFRLKAPGLDLTALLLEKEAKGLPEGVRLYTYFNHTGQFRYTPIMHSLNIYTKQTHHLSEITFPPYGFVMALNSASPDPRLCDISGFAGFDYGQRETVGLSLAVLPTYIGWIPGDYRTLEQVNRDARADDEAAKRESVPDVE